MKKHLLTTAIAGVVLCSLAATMNAFMKKEKNSATDAQGHVLTSLWQEYSAASDADRPKKMLQALESIKKEASASRLHWDFYDASLKYLEVASSRDWKLRQPLTDSLKKEIEAYDEPIVTYSYKRSIGNRTLLDYVLANKARLQAGRNSAFYSDLNLEGTMTSVIRDLLNDDYEYALWLEASKGGRFAPESNSLAALKEQVGTSYPAAQYIEYKELGSGGSYDEIAQRRKEFSDKYKTKAISLLADEYSLRYRRDTLISRNGGSDAYKNLYEDCLEAETKRKSFRSGVDSKIAGTSDDYQFCSIAKELKSQGIMVSVGNDTITLSLRNLDGATVTMYPDGKDTKPVFKKTFKNTVRSFYCWDEIKFPVPQCDDGDYLIKATSGKNECEEAFSPKTLSIALRDDSEALRFYVADYSSGKPVETVDLSLTRSGNEVAVANGIHMDGFTPVPDAIMNAVKKDASSYLVASCHDSHGFLRLSSEIYLDQHSENHEEKPWISDECNIFTDKAAYNPGETVHFKAVLYSGNPLSGFNVFSAGKEVNVELCNTEGKALASMKSSTNEYGSVAGDILIPEGEKNGRFSLVFMSGNDSFSKGLVVDEFVLPTFDLEFEAIDEVMVPGDTVHLDGKVSSYSGHQLSSADVTYEIKSSGRLVSSGPLALGEDGSFTIYFTTEEKRFFYQVVVRVSDGTGETLEFSRNVYLINRLFVEAELCNRAEADINTSHSSTYYHDHVALTSPQAELILRSKNSEGETVQVPVDYEVYGPDGEIFYRGTSASGEKTLLTFDTPGTYRVKYSASVLSHEGKPLISSSELYVIRVDETAKTFDSDVESAFLLLDEGKDGILRTGEEIHVKVGSGEGPLWIVAGLFGDHRQPLDQKLICVDGAKGKEGSAKDLVWTYKEDYPDALTLSIFYFKSGSFQTYNKSFSREKTLPEMPLEFTSFRDLSLPGTRCTLTLKTAPDAEAVAAVFDKSSETIAANRWHLVNLQTRAADQVWVSAQPGTSGQDSFPLMVGYGGRQKGRLMMRTKAATMALDNMVMVEESAVNAPMVAPESVSNSVFNGDSVSMDEVEAIEDVKIRSDFSTSLAFEPFLRPDKDGNVTLEFKTSDKLSTFVVQVYSHDKNMLNSLVRKEMVVSVPVKVSVVEPKYIYQGDDLVLHATVSNSSDSPVCGTLALQIYDSADYQDSKPVSTFSRKVAIPAGGASEVSFDVASKKCGTLGLKVVFADASKTFSDGTFVTVPVLEPQQTIKESHSAVLLPGMDEKKLLKKIQGEFTGTTASGAEYREVDIRQMVLDALPSKVDPSGKDVLSLTEAFYVSKIATMLGSDVKGTLSDVDLYSKIMACRNSDGGFGWFEGMKSSPCITAVVLERMAKLSGKGIIVREFDPTPSVTFLDRNQFIHGGAFPLWCPWLSYDQYMYVRSLYASVPFNVEPQTRIEKSGFKENLKSFKEYAASYLVPAKEEGRGLRGQILAKARRLRTLANLANEDGGLALASAWGIKLSANSKINASIAADAVSLLEYSVDHPDGGVYYPDAVMPWRGLLESEAYAHSILCDMFSDPRVFSSSDVEARRVADGIRLWLMLQKETQKWDEDPAFVDAIASVLSGSDSVLSTKTMTLTKTYRKPFNEIAAAGNGMTVQRKFFRSKVGEDGKISAEEILPGEILHVGDKVTCQYQIWSQENRSFVKLSASREAAFRPVDQLSGHYGWWLSPLSVNGFYSVTPQGYRNVKAAETEYYFDVYPEENTVVSEDFFVTQEGRFVSPSVTIESLYAPHYRANSAYSGVLKTQK